MLPYIIDSIFLIKSCYLAYAGGQSLRKFTGTTYFPKTSASLIFKSMESNMIIIFGSNFYRIQSFYQFLGIIKNNFNRINVLYLSVCPLSFAISWCHKRYKYFARTNSVIERILPIDTTFYFMDILFYKICILEIYNIFYCIAFISINIKNIVRGYLYQ